MNLTLHLQPSEFDELGVIAEQFQCDSVQMLFETLIRYLLETQRERQQMADSEFRGAMN